MRTLLTVAFAAGFCSTLAVVAIFYKHELVELVGTMAR